jgi:pimeloyl-ACP methyl ester carboxylesterase
MSDFTTADGLTLAYDDLGPQDARPILLIHGFSSNREEGWRRTGWYSAIERRGQRLIAMDTRGHGLSAKPHDPAAYERSRLVGDLVALLDHRNVGRADVVGYSMGARLALQLALSAPDRVDHLVLGGIGGRIFTPSPPDDAMGQAMEAADPESISDPMLRSFRHFADEQGEDRLALAALSRAPSGGLTPDDLYGVRSPTLVAAGSRDELAGSPQVLAEAIPGAKAVTLPGCDHFNAIPHALLKASVFDFLDGYLEEGY